MEIYGNLQRAAFFSFFFFSILFIYLYLAVLGLHCFAQAFSNCSEWLLCCKAQALGAQVQQLQHVGSVDATCRLSCLAACGIFPDQGWIEPVSLALTGGLLFTALPGKSEVSISKQCRKDGSFNIQQANSENKKENECLLYSKMISQILKYFKKKP